MRYWSGENELKRRWQTADALADWMIEKECNFFATATFNERWGIGVTENGAAERIRHFYNRQMRKLLGARWYKQKRDQQAFCLATMEYGNKSRRKKMVVQKVLNHQSGKQRSSIIWY